MAAAPPRGGGGPNGDPGASLAAAHLALCEQTGAEPCAELLDAA
jgi:hypothetical protein